MSRESRVRQCLEKLSGSRVDDGAWRAILNEYDQPHEDWSGDPMEHAEELLGVSEALKKMATRLPSARPEKRSSTQNASERYLATQGPGWWRHEQAEAVEFARPRQVQCLTWLGLEAPVSLVDLESVIRHQWALEEKHGDVVPLRYPSVSYIPGNEQRQWIEIGVRRGYVAAGTWDLDFKRTQPLAKVALYAQLLVDEMAIWPEEAVAFLLCDIPFLRPWVRAEARGGLRPHALITVGSPDVSAEDIATAWGQAQEALRDTFRRYRLPAATRRLLDFVTPRLESRVSWSQIWAEWSEVFPEAYSSMNSMRTRYYQVRNKEVRGQ